MSDATTLDSAAIAAVDNAGLLGDILAMPDHIADAKWRAESAMLEPTTAEQLIICGMGGSAVGADLAVASLGKALKKPVHVIRGYDLPSWVGPESAIVLSSYSGSTEETLSCYAQAVELGAKIYVVSSGGPISDAAHAAGQPVIGLPGILQPRASVAYGITAALEIGITTGIVDSAVRDDLDRSADLLRALAKEWSPDASPDALPKRLAREAFGKVAAVYGADLTDATAYRWKCQIQENAKVPATSNTLPEANHNEICNWEGAPELVSQVAWFLRDADQHERIAKRIELTAAIVAEQGATSRIIDSVGESRLERQFSLIFLGDLMSLYLAALNGRDPSPVPIIENLKDSLGRPSAVQ